MKLIFIYGPPAAGKLTVAEQLAKKTRIALFHNHVSRNLVLDIYMKDILSHYSLVDKIREEVFENNTDLIFTFVYGGSFDDKIVKSYTKSIEENGGEVLFVELTANREDLLKRVGSESRKHNKKLTDSEKLKQITEDMSIYSITFVESLKINTSELNPEQAASKIIDYYHL